MVANEKNKKALEYETILNTVLFCKLGLLAFHATFVPRVASILVSNSCNYLSLEQSLPP
jgi:hypothetical protein